MATAEATRLRQLEGLAPVHGPGIVMVIDAAGLKALDLQDALSSLAAAGAEAIDVNNRRVVTGLPVQQAGDAVTIDGIASSCAPTGACGRRPIASKRMW